MYCRMNRVECSYANTNGYCDSSACHNMNVVGNILPKERPENISNSSIWIKPQSNWHTGTPTEDGQYLVYCDDGIGADVDDYENGRWKFYGEHVKAWAIIYVPLWLKEKK